MHRLAALAATLRLMGDSEVAERAVPLLSLLTTPLANLRQRAERIAPQLVAAGVANVEVSERTGRPLGNMSRAQEVPTLCLTIQPSAGAAEALAAKLRGGALPVIALVEGARVVLDLRSVPPRDDMNLIAALTAIYSAGDAAA